MDKELLKLIRENNIVFNYLREDSSFYRKLLLDKNYINEIEKMAKIKYKLQLSDKLSDLKDRLELINTFLDAFK